MKINLRKSTVSLHFEKHKGGDSSINGLQRHNEREPGGVHSNKNIKDERTADNVFLKKSGKSYYKQIKQIIETEKDGAMKNVRSNSVRLVEATVQLGGSAGEASEEEQEQVLRDSYEWLKEKFGERNIVSAVIHKDETSMHLHFDFVPITQDKRLSARDVLSKSNLQGYQDDFLKYLQEKQASMGFERGSGEMNGLSQEAFETVQTMIEESEALVEAKKRALERREQEIEVKAEKALKTQSEANEKLLELSEREAELKGAQKRFFEALERRKQEIEVEAEKALKMQSEANEKLLELSERERKVETAQKLHFQKVAKERQELSEREVELDERESKLAEMMKTFEALKVSIVAHIKKATNYITKGKLSKGRVVSALEVGAPHETVEDIALTDEVLRDLVSGVEQGQSL